MLHVQGTQEINYVRYLSALCKPQHSGNVQPLSWIRDVLTRAVTCTWGSWTVALYLITFVYILWLFPLPDDYLLSTMQRRLSKRALPAPEAIAACTVSRTLKHDWINPSISHISALQCQKNVCMSDSSYGCLWLFDSFFLGASPAPPTHIKHEGCT